MLFSILNINQGGKLKKSVIRIIKEKEKYILMSAYNSDILYEKETSMNARFYRKQLFTFFCISFNFFSLCHDVPLTEAPFFSPELPTSNLPISSEEILFYEHIIKLWSQQLDTIKGLLQKLTDQINSKYIIVSNEPATRTWIALSISHIKDMQRTPPLPEPYAVSLVLMLNEHIINTIQKALDTHLQMLTFIDIRQLSLKRILPTPELIMHQCAENSAHISILEQKITDAGLTKFNRFIRTIESLTDEHPLAASLTKKTIICSLGAFCIYKMYNFFMDTSPQPEPIHDEFGRQLYDNSGQPLYRASSRREQTHGFLTSLIKPTTIALAISDASRTQISRLVDYCGQNLYYYGAKGIRLTKKGLALARQYLRGDVISTAHTTYDIIEDINLEDPRLIGLENQIEKINVIVKYCEDPELYIRTKNEIEKGIIFIGPSRSGKTLLARALAGTINQFYSNQHTGTRITFWDLNYLELTRNKLSTIIHKAKRLAPCIIFIDEIHNLNLQTGSAQLTEFLTEMEELYATNDPRNPVFIIAATNRPELLDQAMLSHRRFGNVIRFEKPGHAERKRFFEVLCTRSAIDIESLNMESLTYQTTGCTYGDLQQIIDDARFAARNQGKEVSQRELQDATNKIAHGFLNKITLTPQEHAIVIAHQAGAVAAHFLLQCEDRFELVTCGAMTRKIVEINEWRDGKKGNPNDQKLHKARYGGLITYNTQEILQSISNKEKIKQCKRYLAGSAAQKILLGHRTSYRKKDRKRSFTIALSMLLDGLKFEDLSKNRQDLIKEEAEQFITRYEKEIYNLLYEHKTLLTRIADELSKKITLYQEDMEHLFKKVS